MTRKTVFKRTGDSLRTGGFVLLFFLAYISLTVIGFILMIEDYRASYEGYLSFAVRQSSTLTPIAVALLPQVGQIAFSGVLAVFGQKKDKTYFWGAVLGYAICLVGDLYTDLYYFGNGVPISSMTTEQIWNLVFLALLFTVGSEVCFVLGFGMSNELLADAIADLVSVPERVRRTVTTRLDAAGAKVNTIVPDPHLDLNSVLPKRDRPKRDRNRPQRSLEN